MHDASNIIQIAILFKCIHQGVLLTLWNRGLLADRILGGAKSPTDVFVLDAACLSAIVEEYLLVWVEASKVELSIPVSVITIFVNSTKPARHLLLGCICFRFHHHRSHGLFYIEHVLWLLFQVSYASLWH